MKSRPLPFSCREILYRLGWVRSLRSFRVLAVALLACCFGWCQTAAAAYVWIKDTTYDTSSWPTGYSQVPQPAASSEVYRIDGSALSGGDTEFDALMRRVANPGTIVHLGPGLFKTRGTIGNIYPQSHSPGFRLQDNSRLIGSGKRGYRQQGTTIQLAACNEYYSAVVIGSNQFSYWDDESSDFAYTTARDIWVTDLEVDGNAPELTKVPGSNSNPPLFDQRRPWYIQGVQLWGTGGCHIERVLVRNTIGADNVFPVTENFIVCINTPPGVSTGNVIADTSVTDFYNPTGSGFCSAISMNRWDEGAGSIQGIIKGCEVIMNGERGWGFGGEFAYNASSAWSLVITNCVARGAQRAFNNDTFPNYFLSLTGNTFEMPAGVCYGMALFTGNSWSRFHNNRIILKGPGSSGFVIDRASSGHNDMLLDNNVVIAEGGAWTGTAWSYNLNDRYLPSLIPVNVHLENNRVINTGASSRLVALVPSTIGFMSGNRVNDSTSLWPVAQPNVGWTFSPNRADLLNDGHVDLLLQDRAHYIYSYSLLGPTAHSPTTPTPSRALQAGWCAIGTGDLNVDGKTDLLLNHPDYGLGYWLMEGTLCADAGPITYQGQPCVLGGTWKAVAVADFNCDGKPDLLMQDEETYLGVWHLNGTEVVNMMLLSRDYSGGLTTQSGGRKAGVSQGKWRAVGTGDFNGDGRPDILFQHDFESDPKTDGQLAVWYMDDVNIIGTAMLDPVRPNDLKNRAVATGDFRRGGTVDIVFQRKDPRQGWGGPLTLWSMDSVNRTRRSTETKVTSASSLNLGALSVIGPR